VIYLSDLATKKYLPLIPSHTAQPPQVNTPNYLLKTMLTDLLARLESNPRKIKGWHEPTSELFSSKQNSAQHRELVSLDGKNKRGKLYTLLATSPTPEEVPWCRPIDFQAKSEVTLDTS